MTHLSPPKSWLGALDARLEIVEPAPKSIYSYEGSLWVRCFWHTGVWWWRKEHEAILEFVCHESDVFWPGVQFCKGSPSLYNQLHDAVSAHNAKQKALRLAAL